MLADAADGVANLLVPGISVPGIGRCVFLGEVISEGRVRSVLALGTAVHPVTIALWHRGRLGKR